MVPRKKNQQSRTLTEPAVPLSSAIASNLAKGYSLEESIHRAKEYISGALEAMLDLGKGSGPMDHGFEIRGNLNLIY